jgi:glucosamine kinase
MIIIADSGSTKADWMVVKDDGSHYIVSTMGFNPFYHDSAFIAAELSKEFVKQVPVNEITKVDYYGTGIHDDERAEIVAAALRSIMPNAVVEVEHDLLASARATCIDQPGIACIIGTGSNTCLYDGQYITDNVSNLGFMAGDEGSGAHLGKKLIQAYFYRELPEEIKADFEAKFPDGQTAIKNRIYEPNPNVYFASFTRFLATWKDHPFIQKLVGDAFGELMDRHVMKYANCKDFPVHFVGSIAHYFQEILDNCLKARGLHLGVIIKKPIDSLLNYHLSHGEIN